MAGDLRRARGRFAQRVELHLRGRTAPAMHEPSTLPVYGAEAGAVWRKLVRSLTALTDDIYLYPTALRLGNFSAQARSYRYRICAGTALVPCWAGTMRGGTTAAERGKLMDAGAGGESTISIRAISAEGKPTHRFVGAPLKKLKRLVRNSLQLYYTNLPSCITWYARLWARWLRLAEVQAC